jgi:hypothetical protein
MSSAPSEVVPRRVAGGGRRSTGRWAGSERRPWSSMDMEDTPSRRRARAKESV